MTPKRLVGPVALTNSLVTNVFNDANANVKNILRRIHVVNKTDSDATFSLWLGASATNAAGTELYSKQKVKARDVFNDYMGTPMASTEFLVGGSDTATALTIEIDGDVEPVI